MYKNVYHIIIYNDKKSEAILMSTIKEKLNTNLSSYRILCNLKRVMEILCLIWKISMTWILVKQVTKHNLNFDYRWYCFQCV